MHKRRLYFLASFWLDGAILANDLRVEVIFIISEPVPSTTRKDSRVFFPLGMMTAISKVVA